MLYDHLSVNGQGHLALAGVDTVEMAEKYGTPLYLLDEMQIRTKCWTYVQSMRRHFPVGSTALYAGKALCFKQMYPILKQLGMGADVVSTGEIHTALEAGFPASMLVFHGNAKTDDDLRYALDKRVGWIVVDNPEELERLNELAGEKRTCQKIMLRLTPGIDPHTFEAVNTGKVDSKFGLVIETGQALEITGRALEMKNVELMGFHCHVGSQIFDSKPFMDAAGVMLSFMYEARQKYGYNAQVLNLGGGIGVRYTEEDPEEVSIDKVLSELSSYITNQCWRLKIFSPAIFLEPGRSIVADAGVTMYTVQSVKQIPGYKNYVIVDGGMTDNPRYALYGAKHSAIVANRADQPADFPCTLAGRCCESGDVIGEDMTLVQPVRGDKVAVLTTGAYNYSMASNYNRFGRPAVVMICQGEDRLAVRRETLEDLTRCDE